MTAAGALMIAAAVSIFVHHRKAPESARPATPVVRLLVERDAGLLRVRWNPDAPEIRDATHAVLTIGDDGRVSQLPLETAELQSGVANYWPQGSEVRFRLEVAGGAAGEIRVPAERRPSPFEPPPKPAAEVAAAPPAHRKVAEEDASPEEPRPTYTRYFTVAPARPAEAKPAPVHTAAPPAPVPVAIVKAEERAATPSRAQLVREEAVVPDAAAEPAPKPSRLGRVVRKIPLLRRIHKEH
jgi:hypothetical protein